MEEAAYFKVGDGVALVRAQGHMTALLCPSLKARIFASLEGPDAPPLVAFDLCACEYMDSTFLGLIVGVYKRLWALKGRKPVLYGACESCIGLLRTIGVLGLVELADGAEAPRFSDMERIEPTQSASARFVLGAHEDLSELSAENRGRFAGLSAVLRKALGEEEKG